MLVRYDRYLNNMQSRGTAAAWRQPELAQQGFCNRWSERTFAFVRSTAGGVDDRPAMP